LVNKTISFKTALFNLFNL